MNYETWVVRTYETCECCEVQRKAPGWILCQGCLTRYNTEKASDNKKFYTNSWLVELKRLVAQPQMPPGVAAERHTERPT